MGYEKCAIIQKSLEEKRKKDTEHLKENISTLQNTMPYNSRGYVILFSL